MAAPSRRTRPRWLLSLPWPRRWAANARAAAGAALFKGFLTVADRCSACDLDLSEVDSGDGPAVFLIFILGFTVVPLTLWLGFAFDLPDWAPVAIGATLLVLLTALLIRPAKAYVVALQYRHRRTGG
ncbi:DUF983 domain-containing protein [Inquilinus sp. CA228]|uniref:DUF983 domain-containing protein n=1 Tax=Inquilinus sp. CA228 TaxID=3455609 RepID=UPI003F8CF946